MRLRDGYRAVRAAMGRPPVTSIAGLAALLLTCLYVYLVLAVVWARTPEFSVSLVATSTPSTEAQETARASETATRTPTPSGPTPTATVTPTYTPISYTPTPIHLLYVVAPGETLSGIARRHNTTVDAIMELNSLSSDLLSIGQELFIPGPPAGSSPTTTPTATSTAAVATATEGAKYATATSTATVAQASLGPPGAAPSGECPVVAFYYAWYGLDQWQQGRVPDMPAVPYSSKDRNAIVRHVEQAQQAGIDAFAVAWYGPRVRNNQTETNLRAMLDVAGQRGFRATVDFETRSPFFSGQADVVHALQYLIDNHAKHRAFLQYRGKPLIFFWAVGDIFTAQGQSPIDAWASIRQQVDPGHNTLWIADGAGIEFLRVFDGHHLYNITWNPPVNVNATLSKWGSEVRNYNATHGANRLWVATVMAGYNDLFIEGRSGRFSHDRRNGAYYKETWQAAINSVPDLVVITSFNEWLEGTQIEPSVSYGDLYLQLTSEWSAAFRSSRR